MAEVRDEGKYWRLVMDTAAKPVETIDEPKRGFKAVIGEDRETGRHVVMNVLYDKATSTLDDVYKRVEQLRTCSRCQTLDKEKMKIDRVIVPNAPAGSTTITGNATDAVRGIDYTPSDTAPTSIPTAAPPKTGVKDMFADVFFDAFFTRPGKYFFAVLSGDEKMMESVMPKNDEEQMQFMDEMVEFMSGEMDFVRSPEQAKEYLSVVRAARGEPADGGGSGSKRGARRTRKELPMMTVY